MPYASRENMLERYGERPLRELTDRDQSLGTVVDSVLEQAVSFGNARVDSAIAAAGVVLPLLFANPVLIMHAQSIAYWSLFNHDRPAAVKDDYAAAVRDLDLIASGDLKVSEAEVTVVAAAIAGGTRTMLFGERETLAYRGGVYGWY